MAARQQGPGSLNVTPAKAGGATMRAATMGEAHPHDSAVRHVTGGALYIDDIREPDGTLHVVPGGAPMAAPARITRLDLVARCAPRRAWWPCSPRATFPASTTAAPSIGDDPVLADGRRRVPRPADLRVVARSREQARRAAPARRFEVSAETPDRHRRRRRRPPAAHVLPAYAFGRGDAAAAIARRASAGSTAASAIGGQEHFYLEGQVALAMPRRGRRHARPLLDPAPDRGAAHVAQRARLPDALVTVRVRRMGGGFGGKESQATQWAALAALAAQVDRAAVQDPPRPRRRHDHDRQAARLPRRLARRLRRRRPARWPSTSAFAARCGYSADLSLGVNDRTMFHADNAYFYPAVRIRSRRLKTNTRVEHRVPRLRRAAGHAARRAR